MATIFLGLGGSGIKVVSKIKENYKDFEFTAAAEQAGKVIFAGIDVDKPSHEEGENIIFIPVSVNDPTDVIDTHFRHDSTFKKWWKKNYYPTTPLSPGYGAGQYRFNGRLLFWHNYTYLRDQLDDLISKAENIDPSRGGAGYKHSIYVINSIGGGTGAGMFIDIGFLFRDLLETHSNFLLYSFIFHGNIWQKTGIENSNMVALGALTELERWMEKPQTYDMKFGRVKLPMNLQEFKKLFDLVILIDKENLDGKNFVRSGKKSLKDIYMDYGAWVLFVLSLQSIDQNYQNVISEYRKTEPFEELSSEIHTKRSRKFSSFGLTVLSVPYNEITEYILGSYITQFKNGFSKSSLSDRDIIELLHTKLRIYEEDGSQLTVKLKSLKEYDKELKTQLDAIIGDLRKSNNIETWNDNYNTHSLESLSNIVNTFDRWGLSIDNELAEIRQQFRDNIKKIITSEIKKNFDFNGLLDFLELLKTKIQLQKKKVEKEYFQPLENYSSKLLDNLKAISNEIGELPTNPLMFAIKKGKFKNLVEEWINVAGIDWNNHNDISFISSKISETLYTRLNDFYSSLEDILKFNMNIVRALYSIYERVVKDYEDQVISYRKDKTELLDEEKLRQNEFPLQVIVPISREDLKETIKKIQEDNKNMTETLIQEIWDGLNTDTRELKGMRDFVSMLYDDFAETSGRNKDSLTAQGSEFIKSIFKVNLNKTFKEKINKDYRIDRSLRRYFERKYTEYQNNLNLPETKSAFLERFKYQIGQDTIGELQKKKIERDEWVDIAMKGFLKTIKLMNNPFWSLRSRTEFEKYMSSPKLEQTNPEKGPVLYRNEELDLPLEDFITIENLESDQFRIIMLTFSHGCPLYLMNCVRHADYELYSDLNESLKAFSDIRFMDEWKDNIEHSSRFEHNDFLYIMSLAFGIIKRKQKAYYYGDEKLGSITDAMYEIKGDVAESIKEEIKTRLFEEVLTPRATEMDIVENYNNLLIKVDDILKKVQPPKGTKGGMKAHNIWQHLKDKVEVLRDSKGEISKKKGDFYKNTEEDIKALINEHLEIKL